MMYNCDITSQDIEQLVMEIHWVHYVSSLWRYWNVCIEWIGLSIVYFNVKWIEQGTNATFSSIQPNRICTTQQITHSLMHTDLQSHDYQCEKIPEAIRLQMKPSGIINRLFYNFSISVKFSFTDDEPIGSHAATGYFVLHNLCLLKFHGVHWAHCDL